MEATPPAVVTSNRVFAWPALASCALLLIPFGAMQLGSAVDWGIGDFVGMGGLLFAAGSAFVLAARKLRRKHWWALGAVTAIAFAYVWAELAVGVLTDLGS